MKPLDLGETVGDKLPDAVTKIRIELNQEQTNIECPVCKKLVIVDPKNNFCYLCGAALKASAIKTVTTVPAKVEKETATKNLKPKDKEDITVKCGYCDMDILKKYITAHLNVHINDHTQSDVEPTKTEIKAEAAPVKTPLQIAAASYLTDKDDVSLKSIERFHYRKIENLSVSSSSTEDQSISDITVTVWLKERASTYNGSYAGGVWQASTDAERVVIQTTYDATDEYYSVSVRLIKTNQYGYSTEDAVPERLCFDATEIREEIKRALLFFKIPPRSVYKRFLKAIRNDDFVVELDKNGRIEYVQTANANDLLAKLKEKQSLANNKWDTNYGHGYCG
jgi:ribosomal protein L37AE/L43A